MYQIDDFTNEQIRGMTVIQLRARITDDPRMVNLMEVYDRGKLQEGIIAARGVQPTAPAAPPVAPAEPEATPDVAPAPAEPQTEAPAITDPVIAAAMRPPVAPRAQGKGFPHKKRGLGV